MCALLLFAFEPLLSELRFSLLVALLIVPMQAKSSAPEDKEQRMSYAYVSFGN